MPMEKGEKIFINSPFFYVYIVLKDNSFLMRIHHFSFLSLAALLLFGCTSSTSIEDVQEEFAFTIEQLLLGECINNVPLHISRFYLDEQPDNLTYKGGVFAAVVTPALRPVPGQERWKATTDSSTIFRKVTIKFDDEKYEGCHISMVADSDKKLAMQDDAMDSAGLTFQTFTQRRVCQEIEVAGEKVNSRLAQDRVVKNLKQLGFTLTNTKTERRLDYTGEESYDVTIPTYEKTVQGGIVSVVLEEEYTDIIFPNNDDIYAFLNSAIAQGLTLGEDCLVDNQKVYWDGTSVTVEGTTVKLSYMWEP